MNTFFVYILRCKDNSYYVGHTDNLEKRLYEHRMKKYDNYTSLRLPVKLMFYQPFGTRDAAFKAERKIKGWTRIKKEALIQENWNLISKLAKKKF